MGTHAAFAITHADGRHECVERTMDGDILIRFTEAWLLKGEIPTDLDEAIGHSGTEYNEDREHDQSYFLIVDWKQKIIGLSFPLYTKECMLAFASLLDDGWQIVEACDCCDIEPPKGTVCPCMKS